MNIKPWESLLKELREGNQRSKWVNREPYAYWKGNPTVADTRLDLMKCNVSEGHDWKARLYQQVSESMPISHWSCSMIQLLKMVLDSIKDWFLSEIWWCYIIFLSNSEDELSRHLVYI